MKMSDLEFVIRFHVNGESLFRIFPTDKSDPRSYIQNKGMNQSATSYDAYVSVHMIIKDLFEPKAIAKARLIDISDEVQMQPVSKLIFTTQVDQ